MSQIEEGRPLADILFVIALALVSLVTMLANLLVIGAFCVDKRLRKTNNFFIVSLTMAGFLTGGYSIPLYCFTKLTNEEPLSLCKLSAFIDNSLATISLWTLAMTSFDRYYMVLNYNRYTQIMTVCRVKIVLVVVWVYGAVVCAPPLLGWNKYIFNSRTSTCGIAHFLGGPGREFFLFYFFLSFPLPLFIVIFCYLRIFIKSWDVYKRRELRRMQSYSASLQLRPTYNLSETAEIGECLQNGSCYRESCQNSFLSNFSPASASSSNSSKKTKYSKMPRQTSSVGGMSIDKTIRATLMVFVLVITYVICTLPVFIFSLIVYFDHEVGGKIPLVTHTLVIFLFFLNNALNPIMYGVFNTNFRGTFSRLLSCQLPRVIREGTTRYSQYMVRRLSRSNSGSNTNLKATLVHDSNPVPTVQEETEVLVTARSLNGKPLTRIHIVNQTSPHLEVPDDPARC